MVTGRGERRFSRRAQISMEYLTVVGISLFLLMPMIIIFYQQSGGLTDDINAAQLEKIGLELMDAAEEVYYLGPPTQKFMVIYLPQHINNIVISQQELLFNYSVTGGTRIYSLGTNIPLNLSGTLKTFQGQHRISVQAQANGVNISDAS